MTGGATTRLGRPIVGTAIAALAMLALAVPGLPVLTAARAEVPVAAPRARASTTPAAAAAKPLAVPTLVAPDAPAASMHPMPPALMHPGIAAPPSGLGTGAGLLCQAPVELTRLDHPLLHTARRLASGKPLIIVAIGSSSTAGAGATSAASSYPSRLAVELRKLLPGRDIEVFNRGVNGEETANMMARFSLGVFALHPQLVLWQVGTNSVLRDHPLQPHSTLLHAGLAALRAIGADVVLIDLQYAPKVLAKPETPGMVEQISLAAKDDDIDVFHRFAIMRSWVQVQHHPFNIFVTPDGLHMNDWGYACWAKLLAVSIAQAVRPPIGAVAGNSAH
jgi:lysophospholipase L1-like esterase